jgi:beta-glucosidase
VGPRRVRRLAFALAVGAAAVSTAVTTSPGAGASSSAPRAGVGTSCPLSHQPSSPSDVPWLQATYRAQFTPAQLAAQVLACENALHPTTTLAAEVSLVGLNNSPDGTYQNQSGWLADARGRLRAQGDFASLGIPALSLEDGPGGVVYRSGAGRVAPTALASETMVAATMDPSLAERVGEQLGLEASTLHYMGVQAPDLNLDRIPNWGRIQETFGEDPVLAGEMGAAETTGILQDEPLVVLKHFGAYGQEASRETVNEKLSTEALYDTYLRAFAITTAAVAHGGSVPADRQVALMCSYGDLNGQRSCVAPALVAARATLAYSGLVRTDLNTMTPTPTLLGAGVSLIKPLVATAYEPPHRVSASTRALIAAAALVVLRTMFAADLVTPAWLTASAHVGTLSSAIAAAGRSLDATVAERAAVLLKNASGAGSLPLTGAGGPVALLAPADLAGTCASLAASLTSHLGVAVTCTVWDRHLAAPTTLLAHLAGASNLHPRHATAHWVAPASGEYLVANTTYGDASVSLDGTLLATEPGLDELNTTTDSTITAVKGQRYSFTETWGAVAPHLSIQSLVHGVGAATGAARAAHTALVLADGYSAEKSDRSSLELPDGQDAVIDAVAKLVPTAVALMTTGPVTMPWLGDVDAVMELWNPARGLPPFDTQLDSYVPAYTSLLDGATSPTGHLPVTFPASEDQSPMSLGTGSERYAYWPGIRGTADLSLAPLGGTVIGYGWYQAAGWPVLFPFGYGLSYGSQSVALSPSGPCAGDTATSLCVDVTVGSAVPAATTANVQLYVAAPSSTKAPRPALVLGAAGSVDCGAGACDGSTATASPPGALGGGGGPARARQYQFEAGCYSIVAADSAAAAYGVLADPGAHPGSIEHASAPFSSTTSLAAGICPG